MKIVLIPNVDRVCVCKNCKKEFTIKKEKLVENYLGCEYCGSLKWKDKN